MAGVLIFVLVFVSLDFELAVSRSRPSVPYGANCLLLLSLYGL